MTRRKICAHRLERQARRYGGEESSDLCYVLLPEVNTPRVALAQVLSNACHIHAVSKVAVRDVCDRIGFERAYARDAAREQYAGTRVSASWRTSQSDTSESGPAKGVTAPEYVLLVSRKWHQAATCPAPRRFHDDLRGGVVSVDAEPVLPPMELLHGLNLRAVTAEGNWFPWSPIGVRRGQEGLERGRQALSSQEEWRSRVAPYWSKLLACRGIKNVHIREPEWCVY